MEWPAPEPNVRGQKERNGGTDAPLTVRRTLVGQHGMRGIATQNDLAVHITPLGQQFPVI